MEALVAAVEIPRRYYTPWQIGVATLLQTRENVYEKEGREASRCSKVREASSRARASTQPRIGTVCRLMEYGVPE